MLHSIISIILSIIALCISFIIIAFVEISKNKISSFKYTVIVKLVFYIFSLLLAILIYINIKQLFS